MIEKQLASVLGSLIIGILLGRQPLPAPAAWFLLGMAGIGSLLLLKRTASAHLILCCSFAAIGALGTMVTMEAIPQDHVLHAVKPGGGQSLQGIIVSPVEQSVGKMSFRLAADTCDGRPVSGTVQVTLYRSRSSLERSPAAPRLGYGDRIKIVCRLRRPHTYGNPGAFDYASFLARQGVRVVAAASEGKMSLLEESRGNRFRQWAYGKRRAFHYLLQRTLPQEKAELLKALITGERRGMDQQVRDQFAGAGAAHLLAISGLHIGFVAAFGYFVLTVLLRYLLPVRVLLQSRFWLQPHRPAAVATLLFLAYYTVFVGGRTASVRAAIMVCLFLLSQIVERDRSVLHTLTLAAFTILLWRPLSLFEVDFQLSFAAVTAMIVYYRKAPPREATVSKKAHDESRWRRFVQKGATYLAQLLTISLLALTATAPITAVVFHRVSAAGLLANTILVPLTGFWIVPLGILSLVLFHVSPMLATAPLKMAAAGIPLMQQTVAWLSTLPLAKGWVFPPPPLLVGLYYVGLGAILLPPRPGRIKKIAAVALLLLLFLGINHWLGTYRPDGRLKMHFLDVGNGSSTLLVLPEGAAVLIDGGGHYRSSMAVGRNIVLPALLSLGLKKLDVMVLTHPHPDHLKGLNDLVGEIPVGEVWDGWSGGWTEEYGDFRRRIEVRAIPRRVLKSVGQEIELQGVRFKVMQCGGSGVGMSNTAVNNNSLVLKISMGAVSLLVPGDLESAGEDRLLERWKEGLKSTVLLVPHHGSLSSSQPAFLDAVRPDIAVISTGRDNRFHHPAPQVIGRLHYIGPEKRIYRTDTHGAVLIETDGKSVITSCFYRGNSP